MTGLGYIVPNDGRIVAGVDEVGRGPLAGPVVTAAVILDPKRPIDGVADSKQLSPARRLRLADVIRERCIAWSLGRAEVHEIDALNILRATLLAMQRAVANLAVRPDVVLVDGNRLPEFGCTAHAVVGGDATVACIGAASILAKVARDAEMQSLALRYPGYGFERHKGYGTPEHLRALVSLGVLPVHRCSFAPVARARRDRYPVQPS